MLNQMYRSRPEHKPRPENLRLDDQGNEVLDETPVTLTLEFPTLHQQIARLNQAGINYMANFLPDDDLAEDDFGDEEGDLEMPLEGITPYEAVETQVYRDWLGRPRKAGEPSSTGKGGGVVSETTETPPLPGPAEPGKP